MLQKNIVFIGPMGAGKTTLGKRLAKKICLPFIDVDQEICKLANMDIPAIFASEGEQGFRKRETATLQKILFCKKDQVIACGGGIILRQQNRTLIAQQFLVVFLDVCLETQCKRIANDANRPLVTEDNLLQQMQKLRDERLGLYEGLADICLDTNNDNFSHTLRRLVNEVQRRRAEINS